MFDEFIGPLTAREILAFANLLIVIALSVSVVRTAHRRCIEAKTRLQATRDRLAMRRIVLERQAQSMLRRALGSRHSDMPDVRARALSRARLAISMIRIIRSATKLD